MVFLPKVALGTVGSDASRTTCCTRNTVVAAVAIFSPWMFDFCSVQELVLGPALHSELFRIFC